MLIVYKNLTIRNATVEDAKQLSVWWNDVNIMAHAGFPNGTGQTEKEIADSLKSDTDVTRRRLIIDLNRKAIGEMACQNKGKNIVEIGVKICDFTLHDKGLGKILLSMLILSLFDDMGYNRIILDTNLNNKRAQHVYEKLGFKKVQIRENSWRNQLMELQSSIEYELCKEDFVNYLSISTYPLGNFVGDETQ